MSRITVTVPRLAILIAIGVAILSAGGRLEATTVVQIDAAELSDQADLVFTGTAVRTKVVPSKDGAFPFTFVTFSVDDVLKGGTVWKELTLRFEGGQLGDLRLEIEGMPSFEEGQTYLLFVRGNGSLGCPIVGWWQGQYRYATDPGSRKRILLDSAGLTLQGVNQGRFKRAPVEDTPVSRGATVVSVEGVELVAPRDLLQAKPKGQPETPDARRVVADLRSFIASRASAKNFRPGLMVESAQPEDVPERVAWTAAPAH